MNIFDELGKENLHHAYLIEGKKEECLSKILEYCSRVEIRTEGNPDFYEVAFDTFKIDDALHIRSLGQDKSFSNQKKIFIISTNSITIDAQNVMLKIFEEPIMGTRFFVIVPEINSLLKTFASRFYVIKNNCENKEGLNEAEKFISLSTRDRLDYIKDLLIEPEEEDPEGNPVTLSESPRSKALLFLNTLENALHTRFLKNPKKTYIIFGHFFKVREFLRMPGSSTKSLMESVALIIPNF
ncbi:MAG: hypothetical protein ABIS26_01805 [Candidatus Paceibacterota bacterium]